MKSKLVGILFIITGTIFLAGFILSALTFFGDGVGESLIPMVLSLVFAIYALILGSSIRSRKKWSWYAGVITLSLALVGNIITIIINFDFLLIVPIAIGIVATVALYSDKKHFFTESVPPQQVGTPQPPQTQPIVEDKSQPPQQTKPISPNSTQDNQQSP